MLSKVPNVAIIAARHFSRQTHKHSFVETNNTHRHLLQNSNLTFFEQLSNENTTFYTLKFSL